ncbi:MAG: hypothetical protein AB8B48_19630 [Pseudomonadales bacterium]
MPHSTPASEIEPRELTVALRVAEVVITSVAACVKMNLGNSSNQVSAELEDACLTPVRRFDCAFGNALKGLNLEANGLLKKVNAEKNKILNVAFPESTTRHKLYLFDNKMEDIKIDSLKALRFLDVRSNPMPDEVYDYLDEFCGVKASHDGNTEEWR